MRFNKYNIKFNVKECVSTSGPNATQSSLDEIVSLFFCSFAAFQH